jgi:hypothetical protein
MCLLRDLSKILGNSEGRVLITGITGNRAIVQQTLHTRILNSEIDGCTRDGLYNLKV